MISADKTQKQAHELVDLTKTSSQTQLNSTHLRRARRRRLDGAGGVQIGQPRMSDDGRRSPGDHGPLGIVRGLRDVRGHSLLGGHIIFALLNICMRDT